MKRTTTVIGSRVHNGWAILVTIGAPEGRPLVVDRRRVALIDPALPHQPFHHEALALSLAAAEALIRDVKHSVLSHARDSLSQLVSHLGERNEAALALPEPRFLPDGLAEILAHESRSTSLTPRCT